MRLKRDREARYACVAHDPEHLEADFLIDEFPPGARRLEKVREEVEARRAMPEELRMKEDTERAEKTRKEKKRGQQAFLQKYHHKGVFHQVRLPPLAALPIPARIDMDASSAGLGHPLEARLHRPD